MPSTAVKTHPTALLERVRKLYSRVLEDSEKRAQSWNLELASPETVRPEVEARLSNLADYLALRAQDLRELQSELSKWGLSSLGRAEGRVRTNLEAVLGALEALCQLERSVPMPSPVNSRVGPLRLSAEAQRLFGPARAGRDVRILVTLAPEHLEQPETLERLLEAGMDCVRINCAHDTLEVWSALIAAVRKAALEVNHPCAVLMDLSGPKLRLEEVSSEHRLKVGDHFHLCLERPKHKQLKHTHRQLWASLPIPEVFAALERGQQVAYDDGHLYAEVDEVGENSAELRVTHTLAKGTRLKPEKGVNFPGLELKLDPLTPADLEALDFVAVHADLIGYSFVQSKRDLECLHSELERRGVSPLDKPIIAKIETARAVQNLPELLVCGLSRGPFGVMIARGDLALELGFPRLAEMQEELLWMCEAASVPIIWATGVLEGLVKNGLPSRGEMTDAAMSARAECVMLNKGAHQLEGVITLSDVLSRMHGHQHKKEPLMRALSSWT